MNEMHGSRSKIPSNILVKQRCAEGFNFGVKGLTSTFEGSVMAQAVSLCPFITVNRVRSQTCSDCSY
jgi:hypothetical protein